MEFHTRAHSFYRDGGDDDSHRKYGWSNPPSRNFVRRGRGLGRRRNRLQDRSVGFSLRHGVLTLGLAGSRDPPLPWLDPDRGGNWGAEPPSVGFCERLACSSPAPVATLGYRRFSHQYHHGNSLFHLKMAGVVVAGATLVLFNCTSAFRSWATLGPGEDPPAVAKFIAASSLILWLVIIVLGRYLPLTQESLRAGP